MQRTKALGVVLVAAMSGSLLVGCTSGNVTTSTSTTPPAEPLVGTWVAEYSDHSIGVLEFRANGYVTYSYGDTPGTVEVWWDGSTRRIRTSLTYLTSSDCDDPTDKCHI